MRSYLTSNDKYSHDDRRSKSSSSNNSVLSRGLAKSERYMKQNSLNTLREFGLTIKGPHGGDNANLCNVSFGEAEV